MTFVDTSFWVALQFRDDQHHADARSLWSAHPGPLLTTNHVMGETWTFLRRRAGHGAARDFRQAAERLVTLVSVHVDESTEDEAWGWLVRHDESAYSFVDATSFAVMRRKRIRGALAFDGDFSAAGFAEVR
ncbi:MAG: PIN domain-containing protein [Chloroflexi bacterium]|nr:MAG: PIN domain-containing protein [Chloroflexota bacterium]